MKVADNASIGKSDIKKYAKCLHLMENKSLSLFYGKKAFKLKTFIYLFKVTDNSVNQVHYYSHSIDFVDNNKF